MRSRRKKSRVLIGGMMVFLLLSLFFIVSNGNVGNGRGYTGALPRIEVSLKGVSLDEIKAGDKDIKYDNNIVFIQSDEAGELFLDVEIKGRGNSTWLPEKKPYRLKFSNKVSLFGDGPSKKWVLLAGFYDDAAVRNDLAFYIANLLGENYSDGGEFVELIVDGMNEGLYYVTQAIDGNMVKIRDEYGIMMEMDNLYCENEEKYYKSRNGTCFTVKDIVVDENEDVAVTAFMMDFEKLEEAAREENYEMVKELADEESLAKYYLMSEFSNNPDAYVTSWYFYKNGIRDEIHVGPMWDYDFAFGNKNWEFEEYFYNPDVLLTRKMEAFGLMGENGETLVEENTEISKLMFYLMEIPEFREVVRRIYGETLAERKDEIMNYIDFVTGRIRSEALKDAEKWGKGDFDEGVRYLKWWVEQRFEKMDEVFGGKILIEMSEFEV